MAWSCSCSFPLLCTRELGAVAARVWRQAVNGATNCVFRRRPEQRGPCSFVETVASNPLSYGGERGPEVHEVGREFVGKPAHVHLIWCGIGAVLQIAGGKRVNAFPCDACCFLSSAHRSDEFGIALLIRDHGKAKWQGFISPQFAARALCLARDPT